MDINILILILLLLSILTTLSLLAIIIYRLKRENKIIRNIFQKFEERYSSTGGELPDYCNDFCAEAVYKVLRNKKS